MRLLIFIVIILASCSIRAQDFIEIQSMNNWDDTSNDYKVIFVSAEWCAICKSNKHLIESSSEIAEAAKDQFVFFELSEEHNAPILFKGEEYYYVQSAVASGRHQLIEHLLLEIEYPSFILLSPDNEIIIRYSGFISESDWSTIFGAILNQTASPDSERNN
ncbi:MAG: hypothetical protein QNK23_05615 [Crocinitomicaceae bacterium]|nr:hypothetical protein [Crocinitomicaceae bacterium]